MAKINSPITQTVNNITVGRRLKAMRTERGLSIRSLAEQSGLNVNTLSLIENGKTSPSVSTLQQIASALEVPITAFFEPQVPLQAVMFQKAGMRQVEGFAHGMLEDLKVGFSRPGLEPFVVTLQPQAHSGEVPIVHTGLEFVYCLEGKLGYEVDGQDFMLEAGDSLIFEARLPHRWHNAEQTPSRSLLVLCHADEHDHPDESHFC